MQRNSRRNAAAAVVATVFLAAAGLAQAADVTPPKSVSLLSAGVTSVKYQASAALSGVLSDISGETKFRTRPENTGKGRMQVMRAGRSQFMLEAITVERLTVRGQDTYDVDGWGPQPLRTVRIVGPLAMGYMVRGDSGIKDWKDLEGKTIVQYQGYRALQSYMDPLMASWLNGVNVKQVPVAGFAEANRAVIEGAIDLTSTSVGSGFAKEMAASPHGIHWMPLPHDDTENWAKFHSVSPMFRPFVATTGPDISPDKPLETLAYHDRWLTYDWQDEELVYFVTKQMWEAIPKAMELHPFIKSWTDDYALMLEQAESPFHPGAIRFYKEIGIWTPEHEAWQTQRLDEEQKILAAWKAEHPGWKNVTREN